MVNLLSGINPSYIASFMLIDNWKRWTNKMSTKIYIDWEDNAVLIRIV
jgi:hypothetical protein